MSLRLISYSLRRRRATIRYPYEGIEVDEYYRGRPQIDASKCILCGACATSCPPEAIQVVVDHASREKTWSINYARCIFCGRCEEVCPVGAITLTRDFELASVSKDDLRVELKAKPPQCSVCGRILDYTREHAELAVLALEASETPGLGHYVRRASSKCTHCRRLISAYKLAKALKGGE